MSPGNLKAAFRLNANRGHMPFINITHHHVHHHHGDGNVERLRRDIIELLGILERRVMSKLDDILKDVTDETTQLDGISTLIDGLRQQVADATKNAGISAEDAAKIDAIFAAAESNKAKVAAALGANLQAPTAGNAAPAPAADASTAAPPAAPDAGTQPAADTTSSQPIAQTTDTSAPATDTPSGS
jgi:hypothetical protein